MFTLDPTSFNATLPCTVAIAALIASFAIIDLFSNIRAIVASNARLNSSEIGTLALPQGIAHGYQTLHPNTQVLYGLTSRFSADDAHVLSYSDPTLQIEWPLPIAQISKKDKDGLHLQEAIALRARKL